MHMGAACALSPFNGATAFRRWFSIERLHSTRRPTSLICFRPAVETNCALGAACALSPFNGATAFRRWKPFPLSPVFRSLILASMGPPPFGDGNHFLISVSLATGFGLQWGHRLSAMETALCGSSAPWIHAKALFSTRIGYRINGHSVRDQLGFAAP